MKCIKFNQVYVSGAENYRQLVLDPSTEKRRATQTRRYNPSIYETWTVCDLNKEYDNTFRKI